MSFFGLSFLSTATPPLAEKNVDEGKASLSSQVVNPPCQQLEEQKDEENVKNLEQDENRVPAVEKAEYHDSVEVRDKDTLRESLMKAAENEAGSGQESSPGEIFFAHSKDPDDEEVEQVYQPPVSPPPPLTKPLECDFDLDPTELYELLQLRNWEEAIQRCKEHEREARTWVSRKEKDGKLRWRLLPLHAGVIFKAPEIVIEALLAAYPKGAECKDDQGMLPLHLAFRNGSSEGLVNVLLAAYPQAINVKDRKGRIPLVLAQASTSPNRNAFMRALERGPTYYAVAAAATERAAVTAEQQALFDAKIRQINEAHQQENEMLRMDHEQRMIEMQEHIHELESELDKTRETSQVLVDHVNTLEAQLKSRTDTERFLATRIAALDTDLKETSRDKEDLEVTLRMANESLQAEKQELQERLESLQEEFAAQGERLAQAEMAFTTVRGDQDFEWKELEEHAKHLEKEWATAKASEAILEAQLKKRIKSEQSLANEVSFLASRLAESAADSSYSVGTYGARVRTVEKERDELRWTVRALSLKLESVHNHLDEMMIGQETILKAAAEHDRNMAEAAELQARLIEHTKLHHEMYEKSQEERKKISLLLQCQDEEAARHAEERKCIIGAFEMAAEQMDLSAKERKQLVAKVEEQSMEIKHMIVRDLGGIQYALSHARSGDKEEDMVDSVVKHILSEEAVVEDSLQEVDRDPVVTNAAKEIDRDLDDFEHEVVEAEEITDMEGSEVETKQQTFVPEFAAYDVGSTSEIDTSEPAVVPEVFAVSPASHTYEPSRESYDRTFDFNNVEHMARDEVPALRKSEPGFEQAIEEAILSFTSGYGLESPHALSSDPL